MITREQYLEALDVVETYHQQLRLHDFKHGLKSWNDLKIGDKVVFTKTMSKDVLPNIEYEVIWIDSEFATKYDVWYSIKCENGKEKGLRKHAKGYRGTVV